MTIEIDFISDKITGACKSRLQITIPLHIQSGDVHYAAGYINRKLRGKGYKNIRNISIKYLVEA